MTQFIARFIPFLCFMVMIGTATAGRVDITEKVDHIQRTLPAQMALLEGALEKDIVVLLGNTGSGKSTLANALANVAMRIDGMGSFVPVEGQESVFDVAAGQRSITKYPLWRETEMGLLCDCPGFNDTEGVVDDVMSAALIRELLLRASSVRVIFVTSVSEIRAARGSLLVSLLKTMDMFDKSLQRCCSMIVVNQVGDDKLAGKDVTQPKAWLPFVLGKQDTEAEAQLESLCHTVVPFRMANLANMGDIPADFANIFRALSTLRKQRVASVNMALSFNPFTSEVLANFFVCLGKRTFESQREDIYRAVLGAEPLTSANVASRQEEGWEMLWVFTARDPGYQLISPLAQEQLHNARRDLKREFLAAHEAYTQALQLKEKETVLRQQQASIARLEACREASERRAREENSRAEALSKDALAAQAREQKAREEVEKAKQAASQDAAALKSTKQLLKALSAESSRLEQKATAQRALAQKAELEQQQAAAQVLESQRLLKAQTAKFESEATASKERAIRDQARLQSEMDALSGRLGEMQRLQAEISQLRGQITGITPQVHATNQCRAKLNHLCGIRTIVHDHTDCCYRLDGFPWPEIAWPF